MTAAPHGLPTSPLHQPAPHESGLRHATGEALYVDDLPLPRGGLVAWVIASPIARGRLLRRDAARARALPGVHAVLFAEHIPGHNRVGPIVQDEPLLAELEVLCAGQALGLVVAETLEQARAAAAAVELQLEPLPARLDPLEAAAQGRLIDPPHRITRGDWDAARSQAAHVVEAEVHSGAQDHFYLETQCALALPCEGGTWRILSSTQHPSEVQREVAAVLGCGASQVVCEVPRLGGGFGGKESQAGQLACLAALGAWATGRPVRLTYNRGQDMRQTGRRHPFHSRYTALFDAEGGLLGLQARLVADCGWTADLSTAIRDRALFHLDNSYHLPAVRFEGLCARTDLASNTAFRGFGGPQGMLVVEDALNRLAERLGLDPAALRRRNLYGEGARALTPYGQAVQNNRLPALVDTLLQTGEWEARRAQVAAFNAANPLRKRGLGFMPVKFGISFTNALLNQAGALVLLYTDGTAQVNHGGTEMGQGLHTKMLVVAADTLGLAPDSLRVMPTATDKVPNTSATAASSGSDLNGQAVYEACVTLRERLRPFAAEALAAPAEEIRFAGGAAWAQGRSVPIARLAQQAWVARVSLSAVGYYRTPGIVYNRERGEGTPFFYFAFGAAITEVEVCGLTGEHRVLRADLLHDVGASLVPGIDRGQIEGAFVQGLGWLTCEEVLHTPDGRLITAGPSTYKIPAAGDPPDDLRVVLLPDAAQPHTIGGSKAVGEPPFMLAISVVGALRQAIAAFGPPGREVELALPATPEAILRAVVHAQEGA